MKEAKNIKNIITGESINFDAEIRGTVYSLSEQAAAVFTAAQKQAVSLLMPNLKNGSLRSCCLCTVNACASDAYGKIAAVYHYSVVKAEADKAVEAAKKSLKAAEAEATAEAKAAYAAQRSLLSSRYNAVCDMWDAVKAAAAACGIAASDAEASVKMIVAAETGRSICGYNADFDAACATTAKAVNNMWDAVGSRKDANTNHSINYKGIRDAASDAAQYVWFAEDGKKVCRKFRFNCNHGLAQQIFACGKADYKHKKSGRIEAIGCADAEDIAYELVKACALKLQEKYDADAEAAAEAAKKAAEAASLKAAAEAAAAEAAAASRRFDTLKSLDIAAHDAFSLSTAAAKAAQAAAKTAKAEAAKAEKAMQKAYKAAQAVEAEEQAAAAAAAEAAKDATAEEQAAAVKAAQPKRAAYDDAVKAAKDAAFAACEAAKTAAAYKAQAAEAQAAAVKATEAAAAAEAQAQIAQAKAAAAAEAAA